MKKGRPLGLPLRFSLNSLSHVVVVLIQFKHRHRLIQQL